MSLSVSISSNLNKNTTLMPVYSNIQLIAVDPAANNYLFYIGVNDVSTYEYSIQQGYNNTCSINLSTVLEGIFTTDVSFNTNNYFSNQNAIKKITWEVISRDINLNTLNVYNGFNTTNPLYVYNGVISPDEEPYFKNPLSFFPNASQGYWLRKHKAPIKILNYAPGNNIGDEHWLSSFNGNFGDCSCNITQLKLTSYKFNGTVSSSTASLSLADKSIWSVNVNKSSLTSMFGPSYVDINTNYCVLQDASSYLQPVTIQLITQNKINNPYNILYTNSLGVPECVLFDRVDEKGVTMARNTYGYYLEKVYYTQIDRQYSVYSSLMRQEDSLSLFDLWISPVVYAENDEFVVPQPVIITDTQQLIANRWNVDKVLQYKINLSCAYRTLVQRV